tara:strand:+ start:494 stop:1678 length:1185 start_codon:yes stop_codon:yes gene_type:complete
MNIGIVLANSPSKSETFFRNKIQGLIKMGFQVTLFANQKEKFQLCDLISHPKIVRTLLLQIILMFLAYLRLFLKKPKIFFRFLRLEKNDGTTLIDRWKNLYINSNILLKNIDWLHFGYITMAINRENVAEAMGIKMSASIRGYDICIFPLKNKSCYDRVFEKLDKLHSISYDLLDTARTFGLSESIPQIIIRPAIDIDIFNYKVNRNANLNVRQIDILTVSRLHWKKGNEYTLQALELLKGKNIKFHFTIIGEGDDRERLIYTVNQLGLNNDVTFLGSISHKIIKEYYKKADIYLQYSIQEGFCNAVLEAQAMGLLTIVSDAEGLSENIINGSTGWVVPKRRPDLLAKQIEEVIFHKPTDFIKIRKKAYDRVREHFNLEKQRLAFFDFFKTSKA